MATYQRTLAVLFLLTLVATWVPSPAQAATALPNAREILLDVAASHPNLLVRINTQEELEQVWNIHPEVRVHMVNAIAYGSWILTTRTVVTSGRWTGRPWLAIGGHVRYFYFAYESATPFVGDGSDGVGDQGGAVTAADGKSVSEFGANLTDIGQGIAAIGAAKGNKATTAIGLSIAGIGIAINAVGLGLQVAEDLAAPSPKQGHVDTAPSGGGPAGSAPSGPTGGPGPNGEGPGAVSVGAPPGFGMSVGLSGPDGSTAGGGAGASAPGPSGGGGSTGDSGVGDE